jgi:hypothetical protein
LFARPSWLGPPLGAPGRCRAAVFRNAADEEPSFMRVTNRSEDEARRVSSRALFKLGWYPARIKEASEKVAKSGNDMIELTLGVGYRLITSLHEHSINRCGRFFILVLGANFARLRGLPKGWISPGCGSLCWDTF